MTWENLFIAGGFLVGGAIAYYYVMETNGSQLKKADESLFNEVAKLKGTDNADSEIDNKITSREKLKEESEKTLKDIEQKIKNSEIGADDESTKKSIEAAKKNIAKHERAANLLKAVKEKGLDSLDLSFGNLAWTAGTGLGIGFAILIAIKLVGKLFYSKKQ